ncbi:MAG: hypothetical protein IJ359_02010 [Erysipelotrichaceae bacterium]|nr:hypothetical protein [Erysipelotrichaceae bacterium]
MQDMEYSYQTLKEVFYVYGCMLNYKVERIVVDRVIEMVLCRLPMDMRVVIEDVMQSEYEDAILRLQGVFKDDEKLDYLYRDENVVFKILFIVETYFYASSVYCFFLIIIVLKKENLYSCIYLFQPKWLKLLDVKEDVVHKFLTWIKQQLSKEVEMVVDDHRLLEYYPFLHKEQVAFYIEHRESHCYYTIQQYMKYNDVCYETSRMHLEQLVHLGWYVKKKVGKKFVYSRSVEYGV